MNAPPKLPKLLTESTMIPSGDAGIELYVRNKRPSGMTNFPAEKILLYVHGATYPSETAFDLPIEGASVIAPAPAAAGKNAPPLGAYRLVSKEVARARWLEGVPEGKKAGLIPPGVFEAWIEATWATDPDAAKHNPPLLRAPNGVIADALASWAAGKPYYDPGKITVPTFVIHAEWDSDLPTYLAIEYFAQLKNVPYN